MSKLSIFVSLTMVAIVYFIFFWYPNADLIAKEHKSIDDLQSRGWITLDGKLFEGSSQVKSVADLDSNNYIISIKLNKKQINNLYSYLLELNCEESEIFSRDLKTLYNHELKDYSAVAFLHGRDCGIQGEWILDREKGLAISTSTFPFDLRALNAYRKKFG